MSCSRSHVFVPCPNAGVGLKAAANLVHKMAGSVSALACCRIAQKSMRRCCCSLIGTASRSTYVLVPASCQAFTSCTASKRQSQQTNLHQVAILSCSALAFIPSWLALAIVACCEYLGTEKGLLHELQIMVAIAEKQRRPAIPPESELPGGSFPGLPAYLHLMQACWDGEPELRPSFESCIITLRGLLEQTMAVKYAFHPPVCSPVLAPPG